MALAYVWRKQYSELQFHELMSAALPLAPKVMNPQFKKCAEFIHSLSSSRMTSLHTASHINCDEV
jgi:hypothetical protein